MNYISHMNAFFSYVKSDRRLTSSHVSLYMALFQCWNFHRFQLSFPIARDEVMALSGIGSKNTYHKTVRDLHSFGYIYFRSSLSKFQKSTVHIVKFKGGENENDQQQLALFIEEKEEKINHKTAGSPVSNSVHTTALLSVSDSVHITSSTGINIDTVYVPQLTATSPNINTVPVSNVGLLIKHKHINKEREEKTLTQKIFFKNT